jgi:peptidoglycan/LPS O-acetylase OafA/YrhL
MIRSAVAPKIRGIDGLRAFAVVAVIAAHSHVPWLHGGGVGVDIFFGISGFLITNLLIKEHENFGRVDLRKFWLRRLLRLMPALLLLIVCVDAFALAVLPFRPNDYLALTVPATPAVLLYFSNWMIVGTNSSYLGWFGPLWSLSVEEQFYLIWPLVLIALFRATRPLRLLAIVAAVISAGAIVIRFLFFEPENLLRAFGTDFRVDMLLAGVLLAIGVRAGGEGMVRIVCRYLVLPAVCYLAVVAVVVPEFNVAGTEVASRLYYTVGLPLVALSTVSIIGFIVTHQTSTMTRLLSWKPLAYTGKISYGMYLWHYPIAMGILGFLDPTVAFFVGLALTYGIATLSWRLVEKPLADRFHDRLRPTRAMAAPQGLREFGEAKQPEPDKTI